jgi:hypothetical protein
MPLFKMQLYRAIGGSTVGKMSPTLRDYAGKNASYCFIKSLFVAKQRHLQPQPKCGSAAVKSRGNDELQGWVNSAFAFRAEIVGDITALSLPISTHPVAPLFEQAPVKGRNGRALPKRLRPEIVLAETTHVSSSLFQNEAACGVIPQLLPSMKVEVKAAGSGIAPFKRARAIISLRRERSLRADALSEFWSQSLQIDVCDRVSKRRHMFLERQFFSI